MEISPTSVSQWLINITPLLTAQLGLVLLLRKFIRNYFGARVAYRLWLLPPVWCLLAWLLTNSSITSTSELRLLSGGLPTVSSVLDETILYPVEFSSRDIVAINSSDSPEMFWQLLFYIWLSVLLAIAVFYLNKAIRFHQHFRKHSEQLEESLCASLLKRSGLPASLPVCFMVSIRSPALYGIFRPTLLVPEDFFIRFENSQQDAMLLHELIHYRRHDNSANAIALLIRLVFWFNPFFYFAFSRYRADQELSCDFHVLRHSTKSFRSSYAHALLDSSRRDILSTSPIGITAWGSINNLRERTALVNHHHTMNEKKRSYFAFLIIFLFGTLGSTSIATQDADQQNVVSGSRILLETEVIPQEIVSLLDGHTREILRTGRTGPAMIPADSEYIAFVIDTSGSMTNNSSWPALLARIENLLNLHPDLKGIQVMNDMGVYLLSTLRGEWIPYNESIRNQIIAELRAWNPYSNSTPVEGIREAILNLTIPGNRTSIYVFGDDLQQSDTSIDSIIADITTINTDGGTGSKLARIHGIVFPTILGTSERFRQSGFDLVAFLLELARQNDGTFEIIEML